MFIRKIHIRNQTPNNHLRLCDFAIYKINVRYREFKSKVGLI